MSRASELPGRTAVARPPTEPSPPPVPPVAARAGGTTPIATALERLAAGAGGVMPPRGSPAQLDGPAVADGGQPNGTARTAGSRPARAALRDRGVVARRPSSSWRPATAAGWLLALSVAAGRGCRRATPASPGCDDWLDVARARCV